ncbi:MAG: hypothetical protein AAB503_01265 [Patescibacteria group bacterium]|mgnify:FL=1
MKELLKYQVVAVIAAAIGAFLSNESFHNVGVAAIIAIIFAATAVTLVMLSTGTYEYFSGLSFKSKTLAADVIAMAIVSLAASAAMVAIPTPKVILIAISFIAVTSTAVVHDIGLFVPESNKLPPLLGTIGLAIVEPVALIMVMGTIF